MQSDINNVTIAGSLASPPTGSSTSSGTPTCRFLLSVRRHWVGRDGQPCVSADRIEVACCGHSAAAVVKYAKLGLPLLVTGRLAVLSGDDQH
ncbi:MAG: single-stranded DNA-binding protein, partial [Phycisphaerales bacterium]